MSRVRIPSTAPYELKGSCPLQFAIKVHRDKRFLCGCSSMAECQPSKLATWVRFPSPALDMTLRTGSRVEGSFLSRNRWGNAAPKKTRRSTFAPHAASVRPQSALFDFSYRVTLILDGFFERCILDGRAEGDDGGAVLMADGGGAYARNRLERLLDGRFAVAAHHTGDLHRLFHGCFLLECVEFDGFYFFYPGWRREA